MNQTKVDHHIKRPSKTTRLLKVSAKAWMSVTQNWHWDYTWCVIYGLDQVY